MNCHINHAHITPPKAALVASAFMANHLAGNGPMPKAAYDATCNTELMIGYRELAQLFLATYAQDNGITEARALDMLTYGMRMAAELGEEL